MQVAKICPSIAHRSGTRELLEGGSSGGSDLKTNHEHPSADQRKSTVGHGSTNLSPKSIPLTTDAPPLG